MDTDKNLKEICKQYGLIAPREFWTTSEADIKNIYNGAGPADFNYAVRFLLQRLYPYLTVEESEEKLRGYISLFLELFDGAVVIHDFEFDKSDGTRESFDGANGRILSNMMKIIDTEYPFSKFWLWHKRMVWRAKAHGTYLACSRFGWEAWEEEGAVTNG